MRRATPAVLAVALASWACTSGGGGPVLPAEGDGGGADAAASPDGGDGGADAEAAGDRDADDAAPICADPTCSGHGACEEGALGPTCACDDGYEGERCDRCAGGYQDNDGDGSCLPGCAGAGLACGSHAACDDSSGVTRCLCAAGYQDHDEDGACLPGCALAGLECEERRHCDDSAGAAACVCDRGLAGEACATCAAGFLPEGEGCAPDHEWAVLVYMAADNDLEPSAHAVLDELVDVGSSDAVHVVVLLDSFLEEARALYVEPGEPVPVASLGELDTGDFRTLRELGSWAVTAYPARHTALVLWGHGGGWRGGPGVRARTLGFAFDDHGTAAGISVAAGDLGRALEGIVAALGGGRIDLVGFDACRMGSWEVAVATAPFADVLVASSEDEPLGGWPYVGPLRALRAAPETDPFDLAETLVEAYGDESPLCFTLAATDLAAVDAVTAAVDGLGGALLDHPGFFGDLEAARIEAQGFADPDARDLWDLALRIAATDRAPADVVTAANEVAAALSAALVASRSQPSHPRATGLSIYLPGRGAAMDPAYAMPSAPWSSTRWDDLLAAFAAD